MIFHNRGEDIIKEYVIAGYLRLYQYAVNSNGIAQSYELIERENEKVEISRRQSYYDYYLSQTASDAIVEDLCNEPYITSFGKVHYLKQRESEAVKIKLYLGSAPLTSMDSFLVHHPEFNKVKKRFI